MAAANENQGLKIAVASFVTLTVVLAVTTYFGFSQASENAAKLADAQSKANTANQAADQATRQLEELQRIAGYDKYEEFETLKAAVQKDQQAFVDSLNQMNQAVATTLNEYRTAGGDAQKVESLGNAAGQTINQIIQDPNGTFKSTRERMALLVDNMTQLTTALVLDNGDLHTSLNAVNQENRAATSG